MTHEQLREALRDLVDAIDKSRDVVFKGTMEEISQAAKHSQDVLDRAREALAALDREGAGEVERETVEAFCRRLQQRCVDWGAYWRASDDHGVTLTSEQAIDLLRDVLGVDIEIKSATPPAAEREGADHD